MPAGSLSGTVNVACSFSLSSETVRCLLFAGGFDLDGLEGEVVSVEGDGVGGLGEGDVDGFRAGEGGGFEIRA